MLWRGDVGRCHLSHPGSPPDRHHLGASVLRSRGPTNHSPPRWFAAFLGQQHRPEPTRRGLAPRSLALTTCSAGGGSTSGWASSTGDYTLGCRSRRSSADPLGPPTSPPCYQHAACSKPRGPARRRCTALVRLVRESRPTALLMRCTSRSWTPNNSGMARVCASASPAGSEGRPGSKQVKLSRPARRQCLCGECHRPPLDFATPPGESDPR